MRKFRFEGPWAAAVATVVMCLWIITFNHCASAPPAGTYSAQGQKAWTADQLMMDVNAASVTARNLNATTGSEHLTDRDTDLVRQFSLIGGAVLNGWGSGMTTLGSIQAGLDAAQLPTGYAQTARIAVDTAIAAHGAGASALYVVVSVYQSLRMNISISAVNNPKLAALLGALDTEVASIPLS